MLSDLARLMIIQSTPKRTQLLLNPARSQKLGQRKNMILASIRMSPKKGKIDAVLRTIQGLLEPMRVQPGCQGFTCSRDIEDENVMVLEERWETRKDIERHIKSDGFRTILSLLEEAGETPVVEFHEVSATSGMETIGELRAEHKDERE
jgi:quinol monooxygenase YgiN